MKKRKPLIVAVCVVLVSGSLGLLEAADSEAATEQKSPTVRLTEGELLELGKGALDQAVAVYKEVAAAHPDDHAIAARSLYLIARCERKQGNLRQAESHLEAILEKFKAQKKEAALAARMLKEIRQAGRGDGEGWHWLTGLQENESIQGQIFQFAMALVSPKTDEGKNAARKLLAMGTLAQPVLKKVMETTLDPEHRREIALILAQMADFSQLKIALDPLSSAAGLASSPGFGRLVELAQRFKPGQRAAFIEALFSFPDNEENAEFRAVLSLIVASPKTLNACLDRAEKYFSGELKFHYNILSKHIQAHPEIASCLVAHFLGKETPDSLRSTYFSLLLRDAPDRLTSDVLIKAGPEYLDNTIKVLLENRGDLEGMAQVVETFFHDPMSSRLRGKFQDITTWFKQCDLEKAGADAGRLITALFMNGGNYAFGNRWYGQALPDGKSPYILSYFLHHDDGLGQLEKIIRKAAVKDYPLYFSYIDWTKFDPPSAAFLGLLKKLALDPDPAVRDKVLQDCLPHVLVFDAGWVDVLGKLWRDPGLKEADDKKPEGKIPPMDDRERVCKLLLMANQFFGDRAEQIAFLLAEDVETASACIGRYQSPSSFYPLVAPLLLRLKDDADLSLLSIAFSQGACEESPSNRRSSSSAGRRYTSSTRSRFSTSRRPSSGSTSFFNISVHVGDPPKYAPFRSLTGGEKWDAILALYQKAIEKHGDTPRKSLLCRAILACPLHSVKRDPRVKTFLDGLLLDESVPLEKRLAVLQLRAPEIPLETIQKIVKEDKAKACESLGIKQASFGKEGILVPSWISKRPDKEKWHIVRWLHESDVNRILSVHLSECFLPPKHLETWLARIFVLASREPDDGEPVDEEKARQDAMVRKVVIDKLLDINDEDTLPLLIMGLADEDDSRRLKIIAHLSEFGTDEVMEALVGLLDDKNPEIGKAALSALKKIRESKEEKKTWRDWLEKMKKEKNQGEWIE